MDKALLLWIERLGIILGIISFVFLTPQLIGIERLISFERWLEMLLNRIHTRGKVFLAADLAQKGRNANVIGYGCGFVALIIGFSISLTVTWEVSSLFTPLFLPVLLFVFLAVLLQIATLFWLFFMGLGFFIFTSQERQEGMLYLFVLIISMLVAVNLGSKVLLFGLFWEVMSHIARALRLKLDDKNKLYAGLYLVGFICQKLAIIWIITNIENQSLIFDDFILVLLLVSLNYEFIFGVCEVILEGLLGGASRILKALEGDEGETVAKRWAGIGIVLFFVGSVLQIISTFESP